MQRTIAIDFNLEGIAATIGLGNIWRFPYMMGSYGGSALALIGLTWCMKKTAVVKEFGAGLVTDLLFLWLRWVVPFVILAIVIISVFS